jgi:DNA-binding HxlR family transcriptional regulator
MAGPRGAIGKGNSANSPAGLVAECTNSDHCRVVRETFDRVGDKWSLLVITILAEGPQRFTALKLGANGISQRMLTLTVRKLERDGLVERTVFPEVPPRVEYALTALGETLIGPVRSLADWAVSHNEAITGHQREYDSRRVSGA